MTAVSIVVFALIYVGALTFSVVKNLLPHRFTLLGVTYGKTFKELEKKQKWTHAIVYTFTTLFSVAHVILPLYTVFFDNWAKIDLWFLFLVVYVVATGIWVAVITSKEMGKKQYFEQRKAILMQSPLYLRILEKMKQDLRISTVAPLPDGIAFYHFSLPDNYPDYDAAGDSYVYGEDYDRCVKDLSERWEREMEKMYSSLHTSNCSDGLLLSNFGLTELTEEDRGEICFFLGKEELGFRKKNHSIYRTFYIDYEVVTTTHYEYGGSSTDTKHKRASEMGSFSLPVVVRK